MKHKAQPLRKFQPSYELPNPLYKPGQRVKLKSFSLGLRFKVIASSHTHTQLDGLPKAIPNWELKAR
jgi:hypothetical protein